MLVLWLLIGLLVAACMALVVFALRMSHEADDDELVTGRLAYDRRALRPARSAAGSPMRPL